VGSSFHHWFLNFEGYLPCRRGSLSERSRT
jgi:hypothetical protein